jgi:hypothetical protein
LSALVRRPRGLLTLLAALVVTLALAPLAGPAMAEPGEDAGAPPSLRQVLDTALAAYNDAKGRHDQAVARQAELTEQMKQTELRLAQLSEQVSTVAAAAYRGARLSPMVVVVNSDSPTELLHAFTTVQYMARRDDQQLRELNEVKTRLAQLQTEQNTLVGTTKTQLDIMDKKKKEAETALAKAGGGQLSPGFIPGKATAKAAPRNSDGSFPKESCSVDDPTPANGCITPRTHPLGRACDFSANTSGFVDANAGGADKTYGDRLTGWLIANASLLGVKYVIWYRQIWQPGQGWRSYSGGSSPAGAHTNHVHLSMQ